MELDATDSRSRECIVPIERHYMLGEFAVSMAPIEIWSNGSCEEDVVGSIDIPSEQVVAEMDHQQKSKGDGRGKSRSPDEVAAVIGHIVAKYDEPLSKTIRRRTGNREDAEDAKQELYCRLCKAIAEGRFPPEDQEDERKYIYTAAVNNTHVVRKTRLKAAAVYIVDEEDPKDPESVLSWTLESSDSGSKVAQSVAEQDHIRMTLLTLSESDRRLLIYNLQGYKFPELARMYGKPVWTMKKRMAKIKQQFAQSYEELSF